MKKVKVILSVLLIAVLVATALCCIGCNKKDEDKEYVIGVISDPQIVAAAEVGDDDYASFQDFNAIGQKMLFISEAILKTAVDRLIEAKVDVVLIPGDLTENGSKAGHEMVASQCARLEAAGIPTFVVCGNHDINKNPKRYLTTADAVAQGLTIYEEFSDGTCSVRVPGVSPEEFMQIFNEYGFKDAIARDTLEEPVRVTVPVEGELTPYEYYEVGTMSYVQDLPGSDYRLVCIDASNYYEDENENTYYMTYYGSSNNNNSKAAIKGTGYSAMTKRLLGWVEAQLQAANSAGKKPVVMAHFPINNQMGDVVGQITDGIDNRMNMVDELLELFTQYKVEYTFTGHLHTQHVSTYTDDYYRATVTDIETGCLTNYPLPIRYVTTDKDGKVTIKNEYINSVKEEYLPSYLNDQKVKSSVLTDLQAYALDPFIYDNLLRNFDERIKEGDKYPLFNKVFNMLELDPDDQHQAELDSLASYIYNDLYMKFMTMPLYKTAGKVSLQDICEKYGVTLPTSEKYADKGVFQFFIQVLGKFYKYDYENDGGEITYDSVEGQILRYGVYSAFEVIRTSTLFTQLHAINPDIPDSAISENFVRTMYQEGKIDFLCDGFILNVIAIINPVVEENTPLSLAGLTVSGIVDTIETFLPVGLSYVDQHMPGIYDVDENTILGVPVENILKVGTVDGDPVFEIDFDAVLKEVVFGKVGVGILN